MNVMEQVLNEKIDPALTLENLSFLSSQALGEQVQVRQSNILTGGVLEPRFRAYPRRKSAGTRAQNQSGNSSSGAPAGIRSLTLF